MVEPTGNCTQDPGFYDPVIVTMQKIIWADRKDLPMDGCDTQQSVAARWDRTPVKYGLRLSWERRKVPSMVDSYRPEDLF